MKIVFDTNVIISVFIATGSSKDVFEYAVENHKVFASPCILKELKEKLTKKLGFSLKEFKEVEEILKNSIFILREEKSKVWNFPDKKDHPILDLCVFIKSDFLITGDKQFQKLKKVNGTKIIRPSEFWNIEKKNI